MPRYRKKPIVIDAFQYGVDAIPDWFMDKVSDGTIIKWSCKHPMDSTSDKMAFCTIDTLEGEYKAKYRDWIIRGIQGEIYPCKPDIFEATYEKAQEGDS
jgi:hypothetical protein